ncbi:MAG: protein-glutamate O-methyltransferase CheR [Deltaproteobacteria bacterium]|nr:protein-glutamate O-methyltransferase CheR [Deltaproteobacteria bacterium]MBI3294265.1 protein-glutamate O-methyltransferase CheR [Deltaproteobacteria bacterium]
MAVHLKAPAHIPDRELQRFLDQVFDKYGYDFRNYSHASLRRRLRHRLMLSGIDDFGDLEAKTLKNRQFFNTILLDLSITTTEMFRDPAFFMAFRDEVVPVLKTYPSFKIWQAGCSTGQETYSLAILLQEEGILDRGLIYATDFNATALEQARRGVYPTELIKQYAAQFHRAGGKGPFSQYFTSRYDSVLMDKSLRRNIVFSEHNLATDGVFSEVQIVICRNVLIYFNRTLQDRALSIFHQSLGRRGFLCLGAKESLLLSSHRRDFEVVRENERIFRKKTG